jgi:carbon monoxide dehydrogenase subunit G
MRSVRVVTHVPQRREEVYDFLNVIANHEPFTNHMLNDFRYSGPDRGVGAKARVTVTAGGRTDTVDIEVIAAERPSTIVERNIGANGKRIATGTYSLDELPNGETEIRFEYAWQQAPLSERLAGPLVRSIMRRGNQRSLERLAEALANSSVVTAGAPPL